MKRLKFIPLVILMLTFFTASAQRSLSYWETGVFGGSTNYIGELTEGGDFSATVNETRYQFGIFLKRNFTPQFNLGAEIGYGKLYANDANHGMAERGFEMNTSIINTSLTMDLNFKKFGKYFKRNSNTPYVSAGFGALIYQPTLKTNVDFTNYELFPGSNYTSDFMLAFGWKWKTGESGIFGASINYHFTGTPSLEGFQEKEVVPPNDRYFGIRLFYSLGYYET